MIKGADQVMPGPLLVFVRHASLVDVLVPGGFIANVHRLELRYVLKRELLPQAMIVTPNLPEAAALLDTSVARDEAAMRDQAARLLALGARAVLIKGGHAGGAESADFFTDGTNLLRLVAERVQTRNTHGTGCTISSAIAAGLAKGLDLRAAVAEAKAYITAAIGAADRLSIGSGHGPVHHFHAWW